MRALIRFQVKAFIRRWPLLFLALLSVAVVVAAGSFEVSGTFRGDAPVADILANFTRYSIVLPLVIAVLSYEFASTPRLRGMEESVEVCRETAHRHWLAMMVPPAMVLAIVFSIYLAFKLATIAIAHQWSLLFVNIVAEAVLDVLAPCVIGLLLGVVVAQRLKRFAGYAVIALFAFLIGPYSEIVPMLAQSGIVTGKGGIDLYPIYDVFKILAPDSTWGMDPLYGFPLEQERWLLAGFWLLGLCGLLFPAITNSRARGLGYGRVTLISLAAICLVGVFLPSSELRRDTRFFDAASIISDQAYYELPTDAPSQKESPADFELSRYEMDLTAGRQLKAVVSVDVVDDKTEGKYLFTLYHGYHVSRIVGSRGEQLAFVQEGDYITVMSADKQGRLTFEYSGSGNVCIANYQCVYLPGYFPYYPVPGFVHTWDYVHRLGSMPLVDRNPAEFSVTMNTRVPLVSNLGEKSRGRFEGHAVAPTFVGGLIAQSEVAGHRVIFYPTLGVDPQQLPGVITSLHELEQKLEIGGVTSSMVETATVFQMPLFTQLSASAIVLPGTLVVATLRESTAADILVANTPTRIDRDNLKEAFVRFIYDPEGFADAISSVEQPAADQIAKLEAARLAAPNEKECVQSYVYPAKNTVCRLFYEKIRAEGEEKALRETYLYLSSDDPMSELGFLTATNEGEPR